MEISRAVLTVWYVNCPDPAKVLASQPKADRGFGRKFLAQLNPRLPVTAIGQFPLNRSATADPHEYYIGGYPGIAVVQTVIEGESLRLSKLPTNLLEAVPARNIYAFSEGGDEGYAGFAHWEQQELKRSLCGTRFELLEDHGLPEPFEAAYWAGEKYPALGGISLPFEPRGLMQEAQSYWLGIEIGSDGPDLDVVGYAVDGRPEPKIARARQSRRSLSELASDSAGKLGLSDYDDYENNFADDTEPGSTSQELWESGKRLASRASSYISRAAKAVRERWRS
ncbi:DUF6928 family protein [Corynebacterium flavescens]|uniref:Uncharacterized protein n=1 Tax=Corynebacterium flavescens TaxID=28028 RepID=A0A1L7CKR2_CORFL|nr:hypothetical protein [Corynebacterium flavescens]APT86415.1 hypothetical protein CFLV_03905 [Corynebacterium flavescens]KAA8723621.1 hypothetical protein F4V60_03810 [Corynebacterium flavescens]MDN6098877.1 hypothetical protein [Corynebacterium flavescens]MDN6235231.1 hypothetical protein [Corynebacterium flavescens]MDN6430656.1 hypothetical protein [Corynebacterium flavescens]